jgi:glycosyltransferase involved in cell wall biosynthesis
VCPSKEIANELEIFGFDKDKIHIIPNGINTNSFAPAQPAVKSELKRALKLPLNGAIVIYSGRLENGKGIETLIEAWKLVESNKIETSLHLIIMGSGKLLNNLKEQAKTLNNITFTGWKENKLEYLKASDIFILPSLGEGMPNSLIEAMSCGLACISTDIGGIKELIKHNENGLLFEPGNEKALQDCIISLILGSNKTTLLGASARETILNNYNIEKIADLYLKLYRQMQN